jgi:hypothetical protein
VQGKGGNDVKANRTPATEHDLVPSVSSAASRETEQRVIGRPWLPGQSGNPSGRPPKGHTLADKLRAKLDELSKLKGGSDGRTVGDDVIDAAIKLALSGEPHAVRAVELILDRIDGKVSIPIEVSQVTMLIDPEDDVQ